MDEPPADESFQARSEMWHRMVSLSHPFKFYVPSGAIGGHTILTVKASNIVEVTKTAIKCEADKIIQNWEQRQIPRFKDSPAGPSVVKAVSELHELSISIADDPAKLECFPLASQNIELSDDFQRLVESKDDIALFQPYTNVPNFIENFTQVFDRKFLEEKKENLLFQLSNKNLSLYPDYCNKLLVLQELKYIDDLHQGELRADLVVPTMRQQLKTILTFLFNSNLPVAMKGRVACEMGQNELIITELVLRNILTNLQPPEIAALLSSLVFQAKTDVEPNVTDNLKKMMLAFVEVDHDIRQVEAKFNVGRADETVEKERLNFGLIEVVYEWARNKV